MDIETDTQNIERTLTTLATRVDELIRTCETLAEENRSLQTRQTALLAERDELIRHSEQSRARVDAMVARLRGLELQP